MTMRDVIAKVWRTGPRPNAQGVPTVDFRFDASEPFFAGHFPGQPILPGVFQLEMVRSAAEWMLGRSLGILTIRKAKFQRPIRPGEMVRLQLKLSADGSGFLAEARFFVGVQAAGETQLRLSAT
jgi:3-hydroxymyristoyl/3-hydroxydecanoyl-(acyl carrier protein) dehydratase